MPSLKDYRDRISSVKSTKKITSAMKMVAASKLKKAQDRAEASQPYAAAMAEVMARVAAGVTMGPGTSKLLMGTDNGDQTHLLLVVTSDRGLCGGFNANLLRKVKGMIAELQNLGKTIKIVTVGRKGRDFLKREHSDLIIKSFLDIGKSGVEFSEAAEVSDYVLGLFEDGEFDVCSVLGNEFRSVLAQVPSASQLIPFTFREETIDEMEEQAAEALDAPYTFEPNEEEILDDLLPRNISVQIFRTLLDSAAGEQAARMTAMDNATRNAGDKINDLTLQYNRARQAYITKELIEIISGAEAV